MSVGDNIRKLRRAKHLTREKLAKKSKVIYRTLENIERQKTKNPGIITINKIAKGLGVPVDLLLQDEPLNTHLILAIPPRILKIINKPETLYVLDLLREARIRDLRTLLRFLVSLSRAKRASLERRP